VLAATATVRQPHALPPVYSTLYDTGRGYELVAELREQFGPRDALDCVLGGSLWRRVLWVWWRLWWWLWDSDRATQHPRYQVKTTWSPCTLFRTRMMMWDGCECSGNHVVMIITDSSTVILL
jgi:hypothetical protein